MAEGKLSKKHKLLLASRVIKTAAFGILLLLILTLLSLYMVNQPGSGTITITAPSENTSSAKAETSAKSLYMDLNDSNTYSRYKISRQIDSTALHKRFQGCFYNYTISKDYNEGEYTLIYYDLYGTFARNFTFHNIATAEKTAKGYGVCLYGLNDEFAKRP